MSQQNKILMIALDASEVTLIERWMDDGTLPHLARLRERGAYGRLASTVDWLTGTPWPTFYTGAWPAEHGFYNYLQWRPKLMDHLRPSADWLPMTPFWHGLGASGPRPVVIDVPLTYPPPPFDGVEITGWAGHDKFWPPAAHPPDTMHWVHRRFGPPPIEQEVTGLQSVKALLHTRDNLLHGTQRVEDLSVAMMQREAWDMFLVVFGATHRGGHKLWDHSGISGEMNPDQQAQFDGALREVYAACDGAVGRLIDEAGDGVTTLVFALHGMGPNFSCDFLLPEMLDRILKDEHRDDTEADNHRDLLQRMRETIPLEWRSAVKRRLPQRLQDRLSMFWHRGERANLDRTPAFCICCDMEGYVRINLKGRELDGIVEPDEFESLRRRISEELQTFVDADTGEPIVSRIGCGERLYPDVDRPKDMPDLIVHWDQTPAAQRRLVTSPRYGTLRWPTPGRNPDGRSGHHRPTGWLIAAGEPFAPRSTIENAHILDLAPTVHELLGAAPPETMRGRSLLESCSSVTS